MTEVDFTNDLWLFGSPWCEDKLENARYIDAIALAWVALWNYTIDRTSATTDQIQWACKGLFDLPTDQLVDILSKRKAAFFPDDNRLIERYRFVPGIDNFTIHVTFADPGRQVRRRQGKTNMNEGDSLWSQKGATLSDKSARKEFGLTQEEIYAAFRSGKLQYRESSMHGNPWFRLLRHEVEALVNDKSGKDHLHKKKLEKELSDLTKEARKLTTRLKVIEQRRAELRKEIEG